MSTVKNVLRAIGGIALATLVGACITSQEVPLAPQRPFAWTPRHLACFKPEHQEALGCHLRAVAQSEER